MRHFLLTSFSVLCVTLCFSQKSLTVGQRITGDFNGDREIDTAFVKQTVNAKTKAKGWALFFSDKTIPAMRLGCCEVYLINEGDLNKDKATELSVFQAPENGCTYMWTTYSYKAGQWAKLIPMFLVPTYCDPFTVADLEKKVFTENGKVYYWDIDLNDEKGKPLKKQVTVK
jgi:hypothetical protein